MKERKDAEFKRARRPRVLLPVPGSCGWTGSWEEEVPERISLPKLGTSVAHLARRFVGLGTMLHPWVSREHRHRVEGEVSPPCCPLLLEFDPNVNIDFPGERPLGIGD